MVMLKPKRGRYVGYKGADFSQDSVKNFIDDILGGGGDFTMVDGALKLHDEDNNSSNEGTENKAEL